MAAALALRPARSRPRPRRTLPSARCCSTTAWSSARGVTAPGGRPHAETTSARRGRRGGARRDALCHAGAVLASRRTPPCADAIIAAGVARVVCAMEDPDPRVAGHGLALLRAGGHRGRRRRRAQPRRGAIIAAISCASREGRPMVTLKLARTADGYAAGDEHDPRLAITGEAANLRVQVMRSMHDAIMVGVGTAIARRSAADGPPAGVDAAAAAGGAGLAAASARGVSRSARPRANSRPWLIARRAPREARGPAGSARRGGRACRRRPATAASISSGAARARPARRHSRVQRGRARRLASRLIEQGLADEVVLFTARKPLGRPGLPALAPDALRRAGGCLALGRSARRPSMGRRDCGAGSGSIDRRRRPHAHDSA